MVSEVTPASRGRSSVTVPRPRLVPAAKGSGEKYGLDGVASNGRVEFATSTWYDRETSSTAIACPAGMKIPPFSPGPVLWLFTRWTVRTSRPASSLLTCASSTTIVSPSFIACHGPVLDSAVLVGLGLGVGVAVGLCVGVGVGLRPGSMGADDPCPTGMGSLDLALVLVSLPTTPLSSMSTSPTARSSPDSPALTFVSPDERSKLPVTVLPVTMTKIPAPRETTAAAKMTMDIYPSDGSRRVGRSITATPNQRA